MTAQPPTPTAAENHGEFAAEIRVAEALARAAGALAMRYRGGDLEVELKPGDEPVTAADRASSALIIDGLAADFPEDVLISEENADDLRRLQADRVWYVDPIDGTKDFIRGEAGFSVMIGLTVAHRPVVGVVYQPVGNRLFRASKRGGAWFVNDAALPLRLQVSPRSRVEDLLLVASKSHRDDTIDRVKTALGIDNEFNIGSVGLKLSLISLGERDLYVNPAPFCKSWDTCAPEAILDAAGGRMTDLHGEALRYDETSTKRLRGMVATNDRVHDQVIAKLAPLFPPKSS